MWNSLSYDTFHHFDRHFQSRNTFAGSRSLSVFPLGQGRQVLLPPAHLPPPLLQLPRLPHHRLLPLERLQEERVRILQSSLPPLSSGNLSENMVKVVVK